MLLEAVVCFQLRVYVQQYGFRGYPVLSVVFIFSHFWTMSRQKPNRSLTSNDGAFRAQLRTVSGSGLSLFDRSSLWDGRQVSDRLLGPG